MRIFNDQNTENALDQILFVKEDDIMTRYPVGGYFKKNKDFDQDEHDKYANEYNADEHGDFEEYMSMFEDEYIMLENEYANIGDIVYVGSGDMLTPLVVEKDWACEKYISEWDGSNFVETILYSDIYESGYEDITEQYGSDFLSVSVRISTSHSLDHYYHEEKDIMLVREISKYQGKNDSFLFLDDREDIDLAFLIYAEKSDIEKYRPSIV